MRTTHGIAAAQVVRSPDEIRSCLCMDQSVSTLVGKFQAQRRAYEQQRQALEKPDRRETDLVEGS